MVLNNRRTYLCYNNKDLIRDGFIPTIIEQEFIPLDSFNFSRLKNPPKGVSYIVGRDEETGEIISVRERKKLLPAEQLKIEINFSKTMKSAVSHPIGPGPLVPGTVGGLVGNLGLGSIGFGGITSGLTEITYHVLESRTKINQRIKITQEILDTSIIQFNGFPLSIFVIVKEHVENFKEDSEAAAAYKEEHPQAKIGINEAGDNTARIGLDFSNDQLKSLGKFSQGSFLGVGRKRISGATNSKGLFGGKVDAYLIMVDNVGDSGEDVEREVVFLGDQRQLFITIVEDDRTLKFRGDNKEAIGGGEYPFKIQGSTGIDVTDKQIRIDTTDLVVGDYIYITHNTTVGDRHLRQNVEHKGTVAQGNTIGIVGWSAAIGSEQDIFDYRIRKWKVPLLPNGITMANIDQSTDSYTRDDDYKLTLEEFITIDLAQREESLSEIIDAAPVDEIEGWRLSEAILRRGGLSFFAADYRGIIHIYDQGNINIIFPRSSIRDQDWFTNYLESLDFTFPTGAPNPDDPFDEDGMPKLTYLPSDLKKKFEDNIDFTKDMEGFLFDTAEITNSLLFDREKTHYYRPFANALKTVSLYQHDKVGTGIGIPHLDLLPLTCPSVSTVITTENIDGETITRRDHHYDDFSMAKCSPLHLNYYDLSYGVFDHVTATFSKSRSCEEPFNLRSFNYSSTNYDTARSGWNGPGAWYDSGVVDLSIQEWYPDGLSIDTFWTLETPYFCSDFNSSTRVYIEKMGGNSLDNFSWIYVDTDPFVTSNISADSNYDASRSIVVFSEDSMHGSLSYHQINDNIFENHYSITKIDKTKNHNMPTYEHIVNGQSATEVFDHDQNLFIGQNRILGMIPTYSHGIPISEEIFKICSSVCEADSEESFKFWWNKDLLNDLRPDGSDFGLSFLDEPPRVDVPFNWYVKYVEVEFSYIEEIKNIEKYVSFYFEGTESSVSNFLVTQLVKKDNNYVFRFKMRYYFGGPFQLLGEFWKKIKVKGIIARFAFGNDESIDPVINVDTYKINSGQSAVSYDRQGRILVFYSNSDTSNIDVAISYDDGSTWAYDKNLIRLIIGETANLPFVIKDTNNRMVHLFYVLNDKFLMYKRIDTDLLDPTNGSIEYEVPDTYNAGDYDLTSDDPEREYWGNYTSNGVLVRRELSYFVIGSAEDEYFLEQSQINEDIKESNESLEDTDNEEKVQTFRFFFSGFLSEMKDDFRGTPYAVYIANDGVFRVFFISNNKLSIKRSSNYISWQYDVEDQLIHKNYMNEELNKGFTENISNIQIVRNDYDNSIVSVLYFNSGMLFIRHFQSDTLFAWDSVEGNRQYNNIKSHLEITEEDDEADPPKGRTKHLPIFLVGVIPDEIKTAIKNDIDNDTPIGESDLAIYFPYKDPDNPTDKDANKAMVDIFNNDFKVDINTQVFASTTSTGLIRVFYKDSIGNINGIIIDSLDSPNLEVMNLFNGIEI